MIKITSSKDGKLKKEVCRLVLSDVPASSHRFVEKADGNLEYRLGRGKEAEINIRTFRTLIRTIAHGARNHEIKSLAIDIDELRFKVLEQYGAIWFTSTIVENIQLAIYEFTLFKSKKEKKSKLEEIILLNVKPEEEAGIKRGNVLGYYLDHARDIANTSGGHLTPTVFGNEVKKLMAGTKVKTTVLGEKEIKKLKMGALIAVGQGAETETKFIICEYQGGKKGDKPIVLIGKGITYDTGGLNVKPSGFMHDMHMDMSGGAAVVAAIGAAAKLGVKKNIVALVPTAENAISEKAMRAGDIITAMSGKTVEVLHTDAEGRLILADALTYSERYKPKVILDVATLTGAAVVALGEHASAIMTKDKSLSDTLMALGEESGDLVWPLPLWEEYKQHLKSYRADVSNIATNFSRYGGSIEGGTFLSYFAPKDVPWCHIDMAPRMESVAGDKLAKGAAGEPIRLLLSFIEKY